MRQIKALDFELYKKGAKIVWTVKATQKGCGGRCVKPKNKIFLCTCCLAIIVPRTVVSVRMGGKLRKKVKQRRPWWRLHCTLKRLGIFHLHHDCQRGARRGTELQCYSEQDGNILRLQIQLFPPYSVLLLSFNTSPCDVIKGYTRTPGRRDSDLSTWSCLTTGLLFLGIQTHIWDTKMCWPRWLFLKKHRSGTLGIWVSFLLICWRMGRSP